MRPLLEVTELKKHYPIFRGVWKRQIAVTRAVDDISFQLARGQTLGLVGESGCGKTTVARTVVRLLQPTAGQIFFEGCNINTLKKKELRQFRTRVQMISQDPYSSLNPLMKVGTSIVEPLAENTKTNRKQKKELSQDIMRKVGLNPLHIERLPHEFSGGQRQRIGIGRAISLKPKLIVCDEPLSALDLSIQAQIVNLLREIQEQLNLSYLFISHDLAMVRHSCDSVAVMYLGKIVEMATTVQLFSAPQHPYTQALLAATPKINTKKLGKYQYRGLSGEIPSSSQTPSGCTFHPRCPYAETRCRNESPKLVSISKNRKVACHLV